MMYGTFGVGATAGTSTINWSVAGDRVAEGDEGFTLTLADAVNGRIQIGSAGITILNDDGPLLTSVRAMSGAVAKPASTPERKPLPAPMVPQAPNRLAKQVVFANMARAAGAPSPYMRLQRSPRPR